MIDDLVIFDTEFTAWEGSVARGWSGPGEHREIVQIGAIRLCYPHLEEQESFEILIRPRINSVLSDYFVALTGITNERLTQEAVDFADAAKRFLKFLGSSPYMCFGRDDRIMAENAALYGLHEEIRFPEASDIALWMMRAGLDVRGLNSCNLARAAGAKFDGRPHWAIDDARSIAAAMRALKEKGAPKLF
ncbi:MAG: exonuclease domain-containing protein [Alphaproteobacteria bacterium]|nr:exonuclease domain-containing protein [Alphaproteobacteria bacterium]